MITPDLEALFQEMRRLGATRLYLKRLSPNDTSKNQIYLGSGFSSLQVLPHGELVPDSTQKAGSKRERMKASVDLAWIFGRSDMSPAPHTKLILYPRYPEVRFSGFLRGSSDAPAELLRNREAGRLLFIGTGEDNRVLAWACGPTSRVAKQVPDSDTLLKIGLFEDLSARLAGLGTDPRTELLTELRRIHAKGWIDSKRLLPDGTITTCDAQQCGGYTLEAELGIRPNGYSAPDFLGWEIKQFRVAAFDRLESSTLTLMTPEPDGGFYADQGGEKFIRKFGYPDRRGRPDRTNFGGIYYAGKRAALTGLTLILEGFDHARRRFTAAGGICLVTDGSLVAARWSHAKLAEHWNRKHAQAAYVPCMKHEIAPLRYQFGPRILLGSGTDYAFFLAGIADGKVYLDPALKLLRASSSKSQPKLRNQFRIRSKNLPALYDTMDVVEL